MKLVGGLLALGLFAASFLAPVDAYAEPSSHNTRLEVTGVILPAQHIIVDERGTILEILSNTEKDVTPTVYTRKISKASQHPLTPDVYQQYRQLVPKGQSRVGVLYKRILGTYLPTPLETLQGTKSPTYAWPQTAH